MRSRMLTPKLRRALVWICAYKIQHDGVAPTLREIQAGLGMSSTSVVKHYLDRLESLGLIRSASTGGNRCIEITGGHWSPPVDLLDDLAVNAGADLVIWRLDPVVASRDVRVALPGGGELNYTVSIHE